MRKIKPGEPRETLEEIEDLFNAFSMMSDATGNLAGYGLWLVRAVRQLGGVLIGCNHSSGIGQENDTTCPECIGMESLDPDVLKLVEREDDGVL